MILRSLHRNTMLAAFDSSTAPGRAVFDQDGRLRVERANISKANIGLYRGKEIPRWWDLDLDSTRLYRMYRDPEELAKSAPTFNGIPILREHAPISAANHKPEEVVGATGTDAEFEDPYLKCTVMIWTRAAIDGIANGTRAQLSCGYHWKPIMEPGTFEGRRYDGVITEIRGQHVALVDKGRAGADVGLGGEIVRDAAMAGLEHKFPDAARVQF